MITFFPRDFFLKKQCISSVSSDTPRVLINREIVGTANQFQFLNLLQKFETHSDFDSGSATFMHKGLEFNSDRNRDVAILGNCDDGVMKIAEALGWKDDLVKLQESDPTEGKLYSDIN